MIARFITAGLISLIAAPAFAQQVPRQQGFDAHGFQLAAFDGDTRDLLWLHRPGRLTAGDWFVGGVFEYANSPLVAVVQTDDGSLEGRAALNHIVAFNLSAGISVHDRVRLDLAFPLYFTSFGLDKQTQGFASGDVRATAQIAILRPDSEDRGFGLAASLHLDGPTGAPRRFLGQRTIAGGGRVSASYGMAQVTFTGELGLQFNPKVQLDNLNNPDQLLVGLAMGYRVAERHGINLEARMAPALKKNIEVGTETPSEFALSWRYRAPVGAHVLAGLSAGLPRGVGASRFRLFIGGGFGKITMEPPDRDGDGILGSDDLCPEEPETINAYMDQDGCPDSMAKLSVDVRRNGRAIKGAAVVLESNDVDPITYDSDKGMKVFDVLPGTDWRGKASIGCLAGEAQTTVEGDRGGFIIDLEPVRPARVVLNITDKDGNPVDAAMAKWQMKERPKNRGCSPGATDISGGTSTMPIGLGTHTLNVEAPGYRIHREPVEITEAAEYVINVQLVPTKVKVTDTRIDILEKVYFETNSAEIKGVSFGLLDEVATVLLAYPNLTRIEVSGHTDSQGAEEYNLGLSQRRADAVAAYLVTRGVEAGRLVAKGYGEAQPVASNDTASGRDQNRRVEFLILETADASQAQPTTP